MVREAAGVIIGFGPRASVRMPRSLAPILPMPTSGSRSVETRSDLRRVRPRERCRSADPARLPRARTGSRGTDPCRNRRSSIPRPRTATAPARPGGSYRWVVCALLFGATTINYVDRGVLGVLAPDLQREMGWTDTQYGDINAAFSLAYALGFPLLGFLIDRVGTKVGYAGALVVWSLAAAGHALARSAFGFGVARFLLGLGEAGNFPAAVRTTAEWFPRRERALATGIFNSGSNVGAILAPLLVPWIALAAGWQAAFLATGLLGLVWVAFWIPLYGRPERISRVSAGELAWINSDPPDRGAKIRWAPAAPPPPDLGGRGGQVPDRPDLVVLPVLVGEVLRRPVRDRPEEDRPAADRDLPDGRRRLDRRGLALVAPDRPGLVGQPGEEDDAAGLRPLRGPGVVRPAGVEPVDGRRR